MQPDLTDLRRAIVINVSVSSQDGVTTEKFIGNLEGQYAAIRFDYDEIRPATNRPAATRRCTSRACVHRQPYWQD